MAETGWVNLPPDEAGRYEIQQNVFTELFRYRLYRPDTLFHPWLDGKPPVYQGNR